MKVKSSVLSGGALNYAVAMATGIPAEEIYLSGRGEYINLCRKTRDEDGNLDGSYMTGPDLLFSTKWEAGGPIIDREMIALSPYSYSDATWEATIATPAKHFAAYGDTTLIAAMRCFVASKLGDEVDVPEELLK